MRIGILGAGWWAEQHAAAIATLEGFSGTGVHRPDEDAAANFARRFGGRVHRHRQDLLEAPDVDAVLIASPHHLHAEMALEALARGKPFLLEKPMVTSPEELDDVMRRAATTNVPWLVGFTSHYFVGVRTAKALLESGELGRPLMGQSAFQKIWMEHNRRAWHLDRSTGGGMLLTAGIHALDRLMWLMDARVEAVSAVMGTYLHDQRADDLASLLLRMEGGRAGFVSSLGYRQGAPINRTEVLCERGALRVSANSLEVGRDDVWSEVPLPTVDDVTLDALRGEWLDLRALAEGGRVPAVTHAFAQAVTRVVFAAEASGRERREVAVVGS